MVTAASSINFPFERGIEYPLATLRVFEADLLKARQDDCALSNELRAPVAGSPRWIKLRNEELVPLLYYAGHKRVPDAATFMIMPEGCKVDIRLSDSDRTENLQITLADPKWQFDGSGTIKPGGHHQRKITEILNRDGVVGWGPIKMDGDKYAQDRRCASTPELLKGYEQGLVEAITKKLQKPYHASDLVLLVHARKCCIHLSLGKFLDVARGALDEEKSGVSNSGQFKRICILDYSEDYFVESPN